MSKTEDKKTGLNPFKFLDSYTKADRDIFFGREKETEEIYSRLFYGKMLLVYGPSGSGKTSLLQCGVANRFGEHDWKPVFIRRKGDISKSINSELNKQAITPLKEKQSVNEKLYSLYLDYLTPVYLIFDQFEELFIFGTPDEKQEFVKEIKSILSSSDGNTHLIFSIREEYLAALTEFEDEIPELFENRIRIEKMKKPQALEAIEKPCKVGGVEIEEGVSEKVLERLETKSGFIELTWLQVIMDNLYKKALDRKTEPLTIKNEDVDKLGKMGDVLGNFLDEQLQAMKDGEKGEALLKAMVSSDGTKKQLTIDELSSSLQSLGHQFPKEEILKLLQHLINVRIISDKDDNGRYELKHDSLAAKIYEKLTLAEKELLEVRQFIENAYKNYLKTDQLLSKKELNYISIYEDKLYFKDKLANFIIESKQVLLNRDKAVKKIRTYAIIGFLLLISSFGYYAINKNREYKMDNGAIYVISRKDDIPRIALKNALKVYKKSQSNLTTKAVFQTFYNLMDKDSIPDSTGKYYSPYKKIFNFKPCVSKILFAGFSVDEKYIYGYLSDNTVKIWTINGKEVLSYKYSDNRIIDLKMSSGNKYISFINTDSTALLLNLSGNILLKTKIDYNFINPTRAICFSPDERFLALILPNGRVGIYNTDGSVFQIISGHSAAVSSLDFSNNSQFLATASLDSSLIIYYFNHNSKSFDLYNTITGNDIAWSVDFADNNKYLLTANADTSICIWNFYGEKIFNKTYTLPNKSFFSDARFTNGENYIKLNRFNPLTGNQNYTKILEWDFNWRFPMETPDSNYFNEIDIVGVKIMARINKTNKIKLMLVNKIFELYCFGRNYDFFKLGNSNAILVKDSIIRLYPVDEDKIIKLVNEEQIFGDIINQEVWQINPFEF